MNDEDPFLPCDEEADSDDDDDDEFTTRTNKLYIHSRKSVKMGQSSGDQISLVAREKCTNSHDTSLY